MMNGKHREEIDRDGWMEWSKVEGKEPRGDGGAVAVEGLIDSGAGVGERQEERRTVGRAVGASLRRAIRA